MAVQNDSRKAFHELLDLLREVDERWLGPEWMIQSSEDVADGMRAAMHMLQGALVGHFEDDPAHPLFRRIGDDAYLVWNLAGMVSRVPGFDRSTVLAGA